MEIEIYTNILNDIFGLKNRISIPHQKDFIVLKELFELWALKYGNQIHERLLDGENIRPEVIVLANERNIRSLNGLETEIHHGDRIVIITAVAGG